LLKVVLAGAVTYDLSGALNVHSAFQDYVKMKATEYHPDAPPAEQFPKVTTLMRCGESFMLAVIQKRGALDIDEVKKALVPDGALEQMVEAEFQIGPSLRMDPRLQIKGVMTRFLDARGLACGNALASIKTKNAIMQNGTINWKSMSAYTAISDPVSHLVTHFVHRLGDKIKVDTHLKSTDKARYVWSDWRSCYPNPPHKDIKINLFFKKDKKGPYAAIAAAPELHLKGKEYNNLVSAAYTLWEADKAQASVGNVTDVAANEIKISRDELSANVKRVRMDAARVKGAAALKKCRGSGDTVIA
jgi:hypothetical protein